MLNLSDAARILCRLVKTCCLGLGLWIAGSNITLLRAEESEAERTLVDKVLTEPDQERRMGIWRKAVVAAPDADSRARLMNAVPVLDELGQETSYTPEQQREALLLAMDKGPAAGLSHLERILSDDSVPHPSAPDTLPYRNELLTRIFDCVNLDVVKDLLAQELEKAVYEKDEDLASRLDRASVLVESIPYYLRPSDPEVQDYLTQVLLMPDEEAGAALAIVQGGLVRDLEFLRRGWLKAEDVASFYQLSVAKGWWYSCLLGPQDGSFSFSYSRRGRKCEKNRRVFGWSTVPTLNPILWALGGLERPNRLPSRTYSQRGWTIEMAGEPVSTMHDLRAALPDRGWPRCNGTRSAAITAINSSMERAFDRKTKLPVDATLPTAVRPVDCWSSMEEAELAVAESNRLLQEQVQEAAAAQGR